MIRARGRTLPAAAGGLLVLLVLAGGAAAASVSDEPETGLLRFAGWRASFMGREEAGALCWLRSAEDRWRCEILAPGEVGDDRSLLLERAGEGWTLIRADVDVATVQGWRRPFRELDARVAGAVGSVLAALDDPGFTPDVGCVARHAGDAAARIPAGGRPAWFAAARKAVPDDVFRIDLPLLRAVGADSLAAAAVGDDRARSMVRSALESRARGRGAPVETWTCARLVNDGGAPRLRLSSSRRPGSLVLELRGTLPVAYHPDDVFLPLWPLAEVLEFR